MFNYFAAVFWKLRRRQNAELPLGLARADDLTPQVCSTPLASCPSLVCGPNGFLRKVILPVPQARQASETSRHQAADYNYYD